MAFRLCCVLRLPFHHPIQIALEVALADLCRLPLRGVKGFDFLTEFFFFPPFPLHIKVCITNRLQKTQHLNRKCVSNIPINPWIYIADEEEYRKGGILSRKEELPDFLWQLTVQKDAEMVSTATQHNSHSVEVIICPRNNSSLVFKCSGQSTSE